MKKRIIIILSAIILFILAGTVYLNNIFLPRKIKSVLINILQEATDKKATIERVRFNIFKGLVLDNLVIYDRDKKIVALKEASCAFFLPAIFQKKIIIPVIHLRQMQVFLERRKDNAFNLKDLIAKKPVSGKSKFSIILYKLSVADSTIVFQDNSFTEPFNRTIDNLNLNVNFFLPAKVRFNLSIPRRGNDNLQVNVAGEYRFLQKELMGKAMLQGILPQEFAKYYQGYGLTIKSGNLDVILNFKANSDFLYLETEVEKRNLALARENISLLLQGKTNLKFSYNLKNKTYKLHGKTAVFDSSLLGLEKVGTLSDIKAELTFDESNVSCPQLNASIWGIPFTANFTLRDFNNPSWDARIFCRTGLERIKVILQDKFNLGIPVQVSGDGVFSLEIKNGSGQYPFQLRGLLELSNASLKIEKPGLIFQDIKGKLEFTPDSLNCAPLTFSYAGTPYRLEAVVENFKYPRVRMKLASEQLSMKSVFSVADKLIQINQGNVAIHNSRFLFAGRLDIANPYAIQADISGKAKIELTDILKFNLAFKDRLYQAAPEGTINARFRIKGNPQNFKSCSINADLWGAGVSLYGLKAKNLTMDYLQEDGAAAINSLHMNMYSGSVDTYVKINFNSKDYPYLANIAVSGLKIEELKQDTPAKNKDISGIITLGARLSGFLSDISRTNGGGKIMIKDGRIWNIDLFKGLGSIIFTQDFANIVFSEGACTFTIAERHLFTEDLLLKSNITDLSGSLNIGFDGSLSGSLDVQIIDEMVPITGTFRDLTTAIVGRSGRFGTIKISGTLKEPKYKFQTAVMDILKSIKKTLFGE
ncbi:MAG: DUF748 domain-containing protein [Candidatus Omnitrophica bacterium]|nr:DUF748 domain-containing protein [Candidatus Omnitrophota bacterium]